MFLVRHTAASRPLTATSALFHNSLTKALVPQVFEPGRPSRRFGAPNHGPCTPPHAAARPRHLLALLRRGHKLTLWRPGMAKAIRQGTAATAPGGALRSGGHPGAAQPPLDLSLGHIRTRDSEADAELVENIGPFRVVFGADARRARVFTDRSAFPNRQQRRAAEREFCKVAECNWDETSFEVSKWRRP
jgi:hypothetical protein